MYQCRHGWLRASSDTTDLSPADGQPHYVLVGLPDFCVENRQRHYFMSCVIQEEPLFCGETLGEKYRVHRFSVLALAAPNLTKDNN